MRSPLEVADKIARAALEELERLPDMQNLMVSRTSLRELAESYLYLREQSRGSNQESRPKKDTTA